MLAPDPRGGVLVGLYGDQFREFTIFSINADGTHCAAYTLSPEFTPTQMGATASGALYFTDNAVGYWRAHF